MKKRYMTAVLMAAFCGLSTVSAVKVMAAENFQTNYIRDKDSPTVLAVKEASTRPTQIQYKDGVGRVMYQGSEIWTAPRKVTYDGNGGVFSDGNPVNTITVQQNYNSGMNDIINGKMKGVTRTGYTFDSWLFDSGSPVPDMNYYPQYVLYQNLGAKAQWNLITYNLTYNYNGGSTSNPATYTVESPDIRLNNPTKRGYDFTGWTGSNGSSAQTAVTIPHGSVGNKGYNANWRPVVYSIGYNYNGGSNPGNPGTYTIESNSFTLKEPGRTGYTFRGWTGSNGGTAQKGITVNKGSVGNLSFTANWNAVNYSIGYNYNGGQGSNPASYNIDTNTFTLAHPTRAGYSFTGWSGTGINDKVMDVTIPRGSMGNRSYTANWKENIITFQAHPYEGIADGRSYSPSVTYSPADATIRYGTSAGNYNMSSMPSYNTKGRRVIYFQITKLNYRTATGSVTIVLRNPDITSRSVVTEVDGGGGIDVKGNGGSLQTTYHDQGYHTFIQGLDGLRVQSNPVDYNGMTITRSTSSTNEYGFIRTTYKITNNTNSGKIISIGVGTDTDLGGNDNVPVSVTGYGISATSNGITFAYYLNNTDGVDNVDHKAVGGYSAFNNGANVFSGGDTYYSGDSGIGFSWNNRYVPPYSTIYLSWGLDML